MTPAARRAIVVGACFLLAACTSPTSPSSPIGSGSATPSVPSATPTTGPAPTASPTTEPLPPLSPGSARGEVLFVQRAEDAALVSGAEPIRLTLARTGNIASWFTASPQKVAGVMSTEQALKSLGWRPADDGTTATLPTPRPNGLLATAAGDIAFTVRRANVRSDGTLVLDIRPMGAMPPTTESFGPVSLTLDGVPGVVAIEQRLSDDLVIRATITGNLNQQAVIQVLDANGEILESAYLAGSDNRIDSWLDVASGATAWTSPMVVFKAPTRTSPGTISITGELVVDGAATPLDRVIARWSQPLR